MTLATDAAHASDTADHGATPSILVPGLVVAALIAAWAGVTAVWGFNGFIAGADAAVLLTFAVILRATRQ